MTRINQLAESDLANRIVAVKSNLEQLKAAQRAGSANVQLERSVSANTVDFTLKMEYNVIHIYEIVYTPNDMTFDRTGMIWQIFLNIVTQTGSVAYYFTTETLSSPDNKHAVQRFYTLGVTTGVMTYDVKLTVYAIGGITFSVTTIQ